MVLNIVYMMSKLCNARHHMHDISSITMASYMRDVTSEQTMLPVKADLLLGPNSSSEMDLGTDDQSYSPTEVYALT